MQKLIFLFAPAHGRRGSKLMRCDQLADILARHVPDTYQIEIRAVDSMVKPRRQRLQIAEIKGAFVILSKGLIAKLSDENLDRLKAQGNRVAADYVDNAKAIRAHDAINLHILASHRSLEKARASGCELRYLRHHYDPRLDTLTPTTRDAFSAVYVGHPNNRARIEAIEPDLRVFEIDDNSGFADALPTLAGAPFHYNVRPDRAVQLEKPFTKGFTAAACGANILVQRDTDGALEYLGTDYPYLTATAQPSDVLPVWQRAKEGYGSREWTDALEQMQSLRALASPANIAKDFNAILEDLR